MKKENKPISLNRAEAERRIIGIFAEPGIVKGKGQIEVSGTMFGTTATIDLDQRDSSGKAKITYEREFKPQSSPVLMEKEKKGFFATIFRRR